MPRTSDRGVTRGDDGDGLVGRARDAYGVAGGDRGEAGAGHLLGQCGQLAGAARDRCGDSALARCELDIKLDTEMDGCPLTCLIGKFCVIVRST
jgi:hypothetical protein